MKEPGLGEVLRGKPEKSPEKTVIKFWGTPRRTTEENSGEISRANLVEILAKYPKYAKIPLDIFRNSKISGGA